MRQIVSVTGVIDPVGVGFCQFHEHLLISKGESFNVNPYLCIDSIDKSAEEALAYINAGGNTIIDAQPGGCNRMASGLSEISQKTGLNIICSTGFHKLSFYPSVHWIFTEDEKSITDFFTREIVYGTDEDCDISFSDVIGNQRAGIIKCALDKENLSGRYKLLFHSAVVAAMKTDRTMMVHIEKGSDPVLLCNYLESEGMDLSHVVFCHMDRACNDFAVMENVVRRGVYLELDTIGRFKYHSDELEAEIFKRLISLGYENQLLFSLDTTRARLKSYTSGGVGLDYILKVFINELHNAGISERQISKISHDNCVQVLT